MARVMTTATYRPVLWTPGDWNAFFGFGTNILVNLLVLSGLLRFVLKMPDSLVFGHILPATGLMMCMSTLYYAWLAYQLAKKTGRTDVCALPSGISVPHMFVVCFVIILASWFGGVRYFKGIPAGLVAIGVGTLIAWGSTAVGLNWGGLTGEKLTQSFANFGFAVPIPAIGHVFAGFEFLGVILV